MHKWTVAAVFCSLLIASNAIAESDKYKYSGKCGLSLEMGARSEPDAIGGEIGLCGYTSEKVSITGGLAFLASDSFEDIFGGANIGIRFGLDYKFSPFIGMGMFGGYSKEDVSATNDDIDNDDDNFIDEPGEQKEVIKDVIGSVYPEMGFHVWCNDRTRLTFASKYYITTKGREHDFWMYNFGIMVLFD